MDKNSFMEEALIEAKKALKKISDINKEILNKKDIDKNDILTLNNQAKSNKSEILVLDQMIE